jgi:hypothetical protein
MSPSNDLAVLRRLLSFDKGGITPELAREVLKLEVPPEERERMHELALKNQQGQLTGEEKGELESYIRVGRFMDLWRSKARLALKRAEAPSRLDG